MKFSTREDIEAPAEVIFDALSDFATLERNGLRRGIEIARTDDLTTVGAGMAWHLGFVWRGRKREVDAVLTEFLRPETLRFAGESASFRLEAHVGLLALSKKCTRLDVSIEIRPKTLTARMMLQTLKLSRGIVERRFAKRVRDFAREIERQAVRGSA